MQYRYTLPVKKEALSALGSLLRLLVFIGVLFYLYHHITADKFSWDPSLLTTALYSPLCWLALALMPLNLALESWKWQQILRSGSAESSFSMAVHGVLSGLACGLITPRAIGEYAGRIAVIDSEKKLAYAGPLTLSRIAQLSVTLLGGAAGLWFLFGPVWAIVSALIAPLLLFITFIMLKYWNFPGRRMVSELLEGLENIDRRILCRISFLSIARYITFSLQFILILLALTHLELSLIIAGVSWIFLAKSVLPSVNFLGDLGLREFSAIYFFATIETETAPILTASLLIWCINIALPALSGSFILLTRPR